jgi:hypothetical protein
MRFIAILDHRILRPLETPAGNFERLLASLWRDVSTLVSPAPGSADACCAAAQDPLLLAEWLRAADTAEGATISGRLQ